MVSCYNPVAMFSRGGSGHHHPHPHPHHSNSPQNPYFTGPYNPGPTYHHPYTHHHQSGPTGVSTTQFSPTQIPPEFNHAYQHQLGNMTPETMAAVSWHQPNVMYSACASGRNLVTGGYDDWTHGYHHAPPTHHSFYHHQQHSPPTSTPSPNSTHHGEHSTHHSPTIYPTHPVTFKNEFGHCAGGNNQDHSSQEIHSVGGSSSSSGGSIGSSVSSSLIPIQTPHSPDSGMAISDGVSSTGSPATNNQQHCQFNPHLHQHHHLTSTTNSLMVGSTSGNVNQHHNHHTAAPPSLNSTTTTRPTPARSPYEWLKKNTNPHVSSNSNGGKTRTKDKYRVVYSDTQRVELEKEFHFNRYITINRKSDLARILGLSERQVKIWFQNRRAKDRKTTRKHEEIINREKLAHMVHLQNTAVISRQMLPGNPMCNQGNALM